MTPSLRWLCHRSLHCFPPLSSKYLATSDQPLAPYIPTTLRSKLSSSQVQTRFLIFPFTCSIICNCSGESVSFSVDCNPLSSLFLSGVQKQCQGSSFACIWQRRNLNLNIIEGREFKMPGSQYYTCLIIIILIGMDEIEREFWQAIRSFLIRYNQYNREKGASPAQLEEFQQTHAKLLSSRELKEVVINKMAAIELKTDYHNLIMLTLLQDLARWSKEYYTQLKQHSGPLQCILTHSISVLNAQQQYHIIVPKQNQLISILLSHPNTIENLEQFKVLYRRLKDIKQFYPSSIREHQKQSFLKAIEECIEKAAQMQNIKVVQFIFNNIFHELQILEQTHEYVSQRLKIMKKILKVLWVYHEQILYKIAFLLMKFSYQITTNKHLFNYIIPIYECLQQRLIQRPSIAPLLVFKHLIINNITKLLTTGGSYILLEVLLCQLANIFQHQTLAYFMRIYDWNYLEIPICQESLNILYEYTENRAHEKKVEFDLAKTYITRIHAQIKAELESTRGVRCDVSKWTFYQLKRKEYHQLLQEMNNKPKKLFKRIESITSQLIKESTVNKYVRIIKKSAQLNNRSMIDIFSTDHVVSARLFSHYVEIVLSQCKEYNLQEFMRLFTSNFFLTGESQQIGRVMDTITQLYFSHQEESNRILKSSDATYTFANAILILNTDLHNPKNEEKMSQENFIKMCKKINDGQDLPLEVIKKTYNNIKKNKINTFRDRGNMIGISPSNWINICTDYESLSLSYYDSQLDNLDEKCIQYFVHDVLASIIDEKETAKLQVLVERFMYDDKVFECEIIETLRKIVDKKSHLPLHILQKILELANFKNSKATEKVLSYYWLGTNIITTFSNLIPTNVICEFLVYTWNVRIELQDNLYLRELAEMRRIRQCIKYITKRESKKSIMDMFSNFLSFKQSDDELETSPNEFSRRNNFKALSNNIFDIIKYSQHHKIEGINFLISYIHNEESKQYEQFVSCLFLIFNLLYFIDKCQQVGEDLFYELLGAKESSITKRLSNLGKKDAKLYNVLINYCKFWIVKLLLKQYFPAKLENKNNNNYQYLLNKSLDYLEKIDKEVLNDLLKELINKKVIHPTVFQTFDKTIKKIFANGNVQEIQFFYDKFNKSQTEAKAEEPPKMDKTEEPKKDESKEQEAEVKQALPVEQKKECQVEKEVKETVSVEVSQQIEEKTIVKQSSIEDMQNYINPDEVIDKIENEIEEHLKEDITSERQQQVPKQSDQPQEKPEEEKAEGQQKQSKDQEAPSIPVVMF